MKNITTRLLSILLVLALTLAFVGCGQKPEPDDNSTPVSDVSTTTTTEAADDTTTTEGDDTTTEDVSADDTTTEDVSADTTTTGTQGTTKPTTTKKPTEGKDTTKKPTTTGGIAKPTSKPSSTATIQKPTEGTTKPTTTTTTKRTKKTVTGKTTTTTTTTAPTTTTKDPNLKSIKVLSIGHSFSKDAMEAYLWDLFKSAGYDEVILGYLYIGGCPLEKHWTNVQGNIGAYQYAKNESGRWNSKYNHRAKDALLDEDWDYVTFQPSPDYGGGPECCGGKNDYKNFNDLVNWVLDTATNPYVEIYYHLTWSFATDCRLWSFMYHDYDQMQQYKDFIAATQKYVLSNRNVKGVIPCNTSIENARTTWMGDTFNAEGSNDGYHLNDKGDLVAAMTWVCYFTGTKASNIYVDTSTYTEQELAAIAEAVENAIAKPWEVTQSSYKTKP